MRVLVIGATGNVGGHAVRRALEEGHDVTALARNPAAFEQRHERLAVRQGDVLDPASLGEAVAGQDAVLSCLGTSDRKATTLRTEGARNTIAAMRERGVRRLIVFSAFGAGDSLPALKRQSFMFGRIIMPLLLKGPFGDMGHMEDEVRASGLDWTIVRPSALTKKPPVAEVKVVLGDDGKVGSSIPYANVAGFMVDQLVRDRYVGQAPAISA
jgi:uncharacterized protein YbjT (DUF2867 family)